MPLLNSLGNVSAIVTSFSTRLQAVRVDLGRVHIKLAEDLGVKRLAFVFFEHGKHHGMSVCTGNRPTRRAVAEMTQLCGEMGPVETVAAARRP